MIDIFTALLREENFYQLITYLKQCLNLSSLYKGNSVAA